MPRILPTRTRARLRGFTLPELIASLAVMGIVATLSLPAYFNRPSVTLEKASLLLARDLRAAQNRAAIWRQRLGFRFNDHGYQVVDENGAVVLGPLSQPFRRDYEVDAVFEGVEVLNLDFGGKQELWYDAHGESESGGSLTLRYLGDHVRRIAITKRTGRISIQGTSSDYTDDH